MTAVEENVSTPASERVAINRMADKFKGAMATIIKPSEKPAEQPKAVVTKSSPETPAAQPAEKPPEPEKKSPARLQFEELNKLKNKYKTEADATKAELEKLRATATVKQTEEYEKLKVEHENLRKSYNERDAIVKQLAIERSPEFQNHFNQRVSSAILEAKEAAGDHGEEAARIFQLPASPERDKQLDELAQNLPERSRVDLAAAFRELKRTERDRQMELAKPDQNWEALQRIQFERAQAEQAKVAQTRALLLNHINKQIEPELTGADPMVAKQIQESVARFVQGGDTDNYVSIVTDAARWKRHQSTLQAQAETITKLETQLAELQASQPSLQGGGRAVPRSTEPQDIGTVYKRALAGQTRPGYQPA